MCSQRKILDGSGCPEGHIISYFQAINIYINRAEGQGRSIMDQLDLSVLLESHRLIYSMVNDLIPEKIHALSIKIER